MPYYKNQPKNILNFILWKIVASIPRLNTLASIVSEIRIDLSCNLPKYLYACPNKIKIGNFVRWHFPEFAIIQKVMNK